MELPGFSESQDSYRGIYVPATAMGLVAHAVEYNQRYKPGPDNGSITAIPPCNGLLPEIRAALKGGRAAQVPLFPAEVLYAAEGLYRLSRTFLAER